MNVAGPDHQSQSNASKLPFRWRFSLREMLITLTMIALITALISTTVRLRTAEAELAVLRTQTGYLQPSETGQIAAVRVESDQPLTFRLRVRVPDSPAYRIAYTTHWARGKATPDWYSAIDLPAGESQLTVRIQEDPRDERWKITTSVRSARGTKRMATVLPNDHVRIFRESHDVLSTGITRETQFAAANEKIRLLDERWLVGESGLLLYGNRDPEDDIVGVFVELQPDSGSL